MSPADLIADLRSRINPAYAATLGTESYERRLCVETLEAQRDRLEVLECEHAEFYERWHEHRRALEAIIRVLGPTAPKCEGCAVEIAEALKIARKVGAGTTATEGHNG